MIYVQLFLSFLKIGAFSFGGGYAALPLIQNEVVNLHQWLSMGEFTDLITISQMTPGPIAINAATFVGTKISGPWGAAIATLGCILPSCIIVTLLAWLYLKYRQLDLLQNVLKMLRPAVVAMIATAGVSILMTSFFPGGSVVLQNLKIPSVLIFIVCIYLLMKKAWNPILVMVFAGFLNLIQFFICHTLL